MAALPSKSRTACPDCVLWEPGHVCATCGRRQPRPLSDQDEWVGTLRCCRCGTLLKIDGSCPVDGCLAGEGIASARRLEPQGLANRGSLNGARPRPPGPAEEVEALRLLLASPDYPVAAVLEKCVREDDSQARGADHVASDERGGDDSV